DLPAMLGLDRRCERDGVRLVAEHADEIVEDLRLRAGPPHDDLLVAIVEHDLVARSNAEAIPHLLRQNHLPLRPHLVSHTDEYNRYRVCSTSAATRAMTSSSARPVVSSWTASEA